MPDLYQFSTIEVLGFFLVLLRTLGFVVSWPVFGVTTVPVSAKILLSMAIALLLFPVVRESVMNTGVDLDSLSIMFLAVKEVSIGLAIGYLARLFLFALNVAGEVISISMGLSSAQLFNPSLGERSSANSQLLLTVTILFFLSINGHHLLLSGLSQSFELVPSGLTGISFAQFDKFGVIAQEIMVIGVKISMPVMVAILFMNLAMAVIGRAVPQVNVLITSLPVNILVGFIVLIISLPFILMQMDQLIEMTAVRLFQMLKTF